MNILLLPWKLPSLLKIDVKTVKKVCIFRRNTCHKKTEWGFAIFLKVVYEKIFVVSNRNKIIDQYNRYNFLENPQKTSIVAIQSKISATINDFQLLFKTFKWVLILRYHCITSKYCTQRAGCKMSRVNRNGFGYCYKGICKSSKLRGMCSNKKSQKHSLLT